MSEPRTKSLSIEKSMREVDWLMYKSYEHNRKTSPHISPESWRKIYYNAETYEKIYQSHLNEGVPCHS